MTKWFRSLARGIRGRQDLGHILHFSLSPVQSFIAAGRRTRDMWAGSFLLCWLSANAMAAAEEQGGVITSPDVSNDPFYQRVRDHWAKKKKDTAGFGEWYGSVPNHFRAEIGKDFDPVVCQQAVHQAWSGLAEAVWRRFIEPNPHADEVLPMWRKQIGASDASQSPFWETIWVKGPDPKDGSDLEWIDLRKSARLPLPAYGGGGAVCPYVDGLVVLSGEMKSSQMKFWAALRGQIAAELYGKADPDAQLELGQSERVSAPALVKRLFPLLGEQTLIRILGWAPRREAGGGSKQDAGNTPKEKAGDASNELKTSRSARRIWPSTAHIAAAPWLIEASRHAPDKLKSFADEIELRDPIKRHAERGCTVPELKDVSGADVDGRLFFARSMADLGENDGDAEGWTRAYRRLEELRRSDRVDPNTWTKVPLGLPSTYYTVIAADGDRLGATLRSESLRGNGQAASIPTLLARFSQSARTSFEKRSGIVLYAGGDDVLGFAPVGQALHIALALRQDWREAMESLGQAAPTLSCAICFVDMRFVLRWAIERATKTLDKTAKNAMGRDSLALSILQGGGDERVWAAKWSGATDPGAIDALVRLIDARVGSNAQTYGAFERLPWLWARLPFEQAIKSAREGRHHRIDPVSDEQIAEMILAVTSLKPDQALDLVTAARLPIFPKSDPMANEVPLCESALAILRFARQQAPATLEGRVT